MDASVGCILDFENRRLDDTSLPPFFPDVDDSFQVLCLSFSAAKERRFDQTECAFFLHDTAAIQERGTLLSLWPRQTFARVNPNTGTAPVFRTRRDADITRRIYEHHPVLVDRSTGI